MMRFNSLQRLASMKCFTAKIAFCVYRRVSALLVIIRQDLFKLSVIADARTSQVGHFAVCHKPRSQRGFCGLEVVVGAILRGRAQLRAASALQRFIARADVWAIQQGMIFKPNSTPDGTSGG
jgi:hypothetical protein